MARYLFPRGPRSHTPARRSPPPTLRPLPHPSWIVSQDSVDVVLLSLSPSPPPRKRRSRVSYAYFPLSRVLALLTHVVLALSLSLSLCCCGAAQVSVLKAAIENNIKSSTQGSQVRRALCVCVYVSVSLCVALST